MVRLSPGADEHNLDRLKREVETTRDLDLRRLYKAAVKAVEAHLRGEAPLPEGYSLRFLDGDAGSSGERRQDYSDAMGNAIASSKGWL